MRHTLRLAQLPGEAFLPTRPDPNLNLTPSAAGPTCPPLASLSPCRSSQIVSSSYAAAAYLASAGLGAGKRALLLGPEGTALELEAAGVPFVTARELGLPVMDSPDAMLRMKVPGGGQLRLSCII
jgi:hypothetical protein